jgi:lipoprotein-anchoring transpeptidase ErfK/SrfK
VFDSYLISGRYNDPLPGNYAVFSKSRYAFAGHDGITMEHMVRFAHGRRLAIGFHSIPKYGNGSPMQTEEQLGTYRSSGCVRQRADQAEQLYNWAPVGTPVIVLR